MVRDKTFHMRDETMKRSLAILVVTSVVVSTSAFGAVSAGAASLALSTFGAIVYDETHHHVFVTGGPGTDTVFVLDDGTHVVAKLHPTAGSGPDGLAISPDGSTLYVALADSDQIARFATGTLSEETAVALPDPVDQPTKLAFAGGYLWTGFCGNGGGIASVSLTDDSVIAYQGSDYPGCARVRSGGPGAADRLFAWYPYGEPGGVAEFEIAGGVPSLIKAQTLGADGRLPDVAVSNDGSTMYAAHVGPGYVGEYSTADLSATGGSYVTGDHTAAVAVDGMDRIFAGTFGGGVSMFIPGTPDAAWAEGVDTGGVWDQGIATNHAGSRVFVAEGELWSTVSIFVAYPDRSPTALRLSAGRSKISYGSTTTLRVHAALDGPSPERHVTLEQRRIDGDWRKLETGLIDSNGTFALKVRPTAHTDYRAIYRGDEFNAPRTSDAIRIRVAVVVRGRLVNSYGKSGRYRLYHFGSKVAYVAGVIPRHRGSLRFRLQKGTASGWKLLGTASFRMGDDGVVGVVINPIILHRGDRFRIRAEFDGDHDHAGDDAPYSYFRIT
jgi:sugar lactone lactonase YvrE